MNDERPHPLTAAGKILFVATLLLFGGLLYLAFTGLFVRLPTGRYPASFSSLLLLSLPFCSSSASRGYFVGGASPR